MESYCPDDCGTCRMHEDICFYDKKNLSWRCPICKKMKSPYDVYEYRGSECCPECIEENQKSRDIQRAEIIAEQKHKTDKFKGLDLSDSQIGKANRQILKSDIEIAKKESGRLKEYEKTN